MKIEKVAKMKPVSRFIYWIRERHRIYEKKEVEGAPKPWTNDEILQNYFFTNPYRENDKVTRWFRKVVRDPLREDQRVVMAAIIFRWFNRIETGQALIEHGSSEFGLLEKWNPKSATKLLEHIRDVEKKPVFTGAFLIKGGNGPPGCKIRSICEAIDQVWKNRFSLYSLCRTATTLEEYWKRLKEFKYLGGFMAYEIVCDLRYTYALECATDVDTWCNPGPGAKRGLNRLLGNDSPRTINKSIPSDKWRRETIRLLREVRKRLHGMPPFEMREVEHSLCEWDKYERALHGNLSGMKRRYRGLPD